MVNPCQLIYRICEMNGNFLTQYSSELIFVHVLALVS